MAKKTKEDAVPFDIVNGNFDDHDGYDIEVSLQAKLREQVSGVSVNGTNMEKNNGVVNIVLPPIPTVSADVNNTSNPNAAQAGAVAQELNGIKSNLIHNARQGAVSPDGSEVALEFLDSENDVLFSVDIPAAQDVGEVIYPVITATRITPARMKLGDSVRISWQYDCLSNQQQCDRISWHCQRQSDATK